MTPNGKLTKLIQNTAKFLFQRTNGLRVKMGQIWGYDKPTILRPRLTFTWKVLCGNVRTSKSPKRIAHADRMQRSSFSSDGERKRLCYPPHTIENMTA